MESRWNLAMFLVVSLHDEWGDERSAYLSNTLLREVERLDGFWE